MYICTTFVCTTIELHDSGFYQFSKMTSTRRGKIWSLLNIHVQTFREFFFQTSTLILFYKNENTYSFTKITSLFYLMLNLFHILDSIFIVNDVWKNMLQRNSPWVSASSTISLLKSIPRTHTCLIRKLSTMYIIVSKLLGRACVSYSELFSYILYVYFIHLYTLRLGKTAR